VKDVKAPSTAGYTVEALSPATWDAFAALVERHNGVWGGCWCTWFHTMSAEKEREAGANRVLKQRLVEEGRAHAALVFDGDVAVGWCEYGAPEELPNIYHRKEYEELLVQLPDYRITCLFVDKNHRHKGVAAIALRGALQLIARAGGGVVESYPQDTPDKKVSGSLLFNGTRGMFEKAGFDYVRAKGKNHCLMSITVPATPPTPATPAASD
jgi:GNAT superfamily N-acetyltransferase